ncbi:hypothetical protein Tco_0276253 [Tanacetum coccineum]
MLGLLCWDGATVMSDSERELCIDVNGLSLSSLLRSDSAVCGDVGVMGVEWRSGCVEKQIVGVGASGVGGWMGESAGAGFGRGDEMRDAWLGQAPCWVCWVKGRFGIEVGRGACDEDGVFLGVIVVGWVWGGKVKVGLSVIGSVSARGEEVGVGWSGGGLHER